jgi:hypothetical protein
MQTLDQDLMELVEQSIIPPELAQKFSNRPTKYEGMTAGAETEEA